jgi:hypothetical protein
MVHEKYWHGRIRKTKGKKKGDEESKEKREGVG